MRVCVRVCVCVCGAGVRYAPGVARAFVLPGAPAGAAPAVAVAGDGDQRGYILVPPPAGGGGDGGMHSRMGGGYEQVQFWDCGGMTGGLAVGDVDGDPRTTEVFLACYDSGRVEVFSVAA